MNSDQGPQLTGRNVKGLMGGCHSDISIWPTPEIGALAPETLKQYLRRKKAVELYLLGSSDKFIAEECQIRLNHIYRLITERCLAPHPDGLIYGWRGLIPNLRIKEYNRTKKIHIDANGRGASGAMQLLLETHPDLHERLIRRILSSPSKNQIGLIKTPRIVHWQWFINELAKYGYEAKEQWPFNTKSRAYQTICRFIDDVINENSSKAQRMLGGPNLERKLISGDGVNRPISKIYERVEMDAHKIDGIFCVMMPHSSGGYIPVVIHRIWVIVIIDIVSKAVLGYHLSMNREVNKEDILRTIKKALSSWNPLPISFGEPYIEGAGFPSTVSEKFRGMCWDETCVDGALAETCIHVQTVLENVVGSQLITPKTGYSSRRSKDDRPFVETFFRKLGAYGFQRLSNSTGNKAGSTQGRNPDKVAENCRFQIEYAEELLDVLIANYNATPHSSLGYRTPLKFMKYIFDEDSRSVRYADPNLVQGLLSFGKKCKVKGDLTKGRKPYVNFSGARYSSEILSQRYDLIGSEIWIINHLEDDARVVKASLLTGASIGILRAAPPWHKSPHTLAIRKAINSCVHNKHISLTTNSDAIQMFIEFCEKQKGKKLPIHRGYLEARRVLGQWADFDISDNVAEKTFFDENPVGTFSMNESDQKVALQQPLPTRRMAIAKKIEDDNK